MDRDSLMIVIAAFVFAALENQFPYVAYVSSLYSRTYTNLLLGVINVCLNQVMIAAPLGWITQQVNWSGLIRLIPSISLQFIFVFLLLDAYLYGWHRLMHSHNLAWRFHHIHHTQNQINTSTAYRFHPVEAVFSNVPKLLIIWLLGIEINQLLVYELTFAIALMFHHCNCSIPYRFERLLSIFLITPSVHRMHHSKNIQQSNSNLGSVLSIWDRFFCTFYLPSAIKPTEPEYPEYFRKLNALQLLLLPFMISHRKTVKPAKSRRKSS